ncbi:MAG: UPF0175 family protein [Bryobacteraceae bacterium]
MQITVELPEDIAKQLGGDDAALARTALASIALEGIRSGKLSRGQVRRLLGFSTRYEVDGFLKTHGVGEPVTLEDVRRDSETALAYRER